MRQLVIVILTIIYINTILIAKLSKIIRVKRTKKNRVIINGTFHNPNWFQAHIAPIALSNYGEVFLVTDEPLDSMPNLHYSCPPKIVSKILTRAGSKFIWTIWTGIKHPADIYIGYHIFPSAISVLIAASLLGGKSCYQVTSGPLELKGGGYQAENILLSSLCAPSVFVEYLVNKVVCCFDLVVVRGSEAKNYIKDIDFKNMLEVVTGSVLTDQSYIKETRDIDVIFIGRLAEYKQPDLALMVVNEVLKELQTIKVKIVGDGPLKPMLQQLTEELNIQNNVEFLGQRKDVYELLGRSKVLILTSRWEGVSIAMLEGMALGVVPVVPDVGDLKDFVKNEETGYVISNNQLHDFQRSIIRILDDGEVRSKLSSNAMALVYEKCDRELLSKRWKNILESV